MAEPEELVYSTKPMDRERMPDLVNETYDRVGLTRPQRIYLAENPLDALLYMGTFYKAYLKIYEPYLQWPHASLPTVRVKLPDKSSVKIEQMICSPTRTSIRYNAANVLFTMPRELLRYTGANSAHTPMQTTNYDIINAWVREFSAWKTEYPKMLPRMESLRGYWAGGRYWRIPWSEWGISAYSRLMGYQVEASRELALSAFASFCFEAFAIVIDRPLAWHFDASGRLSRDPREGPAIEWRDGVGTYVINGVRIPKLTRKLSPQRILRYQNQEVRRVLIEHYGGMRKFLHALGAKVVQSDKYGELVQGGQAWDAEPGFPEPLSYVIVKNSTPEPDGHYREHALRVSPQVRTAHQGVASTFGKTVDEYHPDVET